MFNVVKVAHDSSCRGKFYLTALHEDSYALEKRGLIGLNLN